MLNMALHPTVLETRGRELTHQIKDAEAKHDALAVDALIQEKAALIRQQRRYVHIISDRQAITEQP